MAQGHHALLAIHLAIVFAFEHRVVEHACSAHEIDAVIGEIPPALLVVPLEHLDLYAPIPESDL
jgi:hypothetical protein